MGRTAMAVAFAAVMVGGCARFEIYDNAALTGNETGIKFYTPKPYVLVGRVGGTSKPVEVSIVYLPDLSKPYYAKARSGWGSSNLTMKLSDGRITEFGQQVDSGGAATISSIASLATALQAKSLGTTSTSAREKLEFSLYEIDTRTNTLTEVAIP
jgi:hypothetical protein